MKKTQKQESAWSEDGGKNEYLTLCDRRSGVMCMQCAWEGEM